MSGALASGCPRAEAGVEVHRVREARGGRNQFIPTPREAGVPHAGQSSTLAYVVLLVTLLDASVAASIALEKYTFIPNHACRRSRLKGVQIANE